VARFVDRVGKGIRGAPRDALIADLSAADLRGAAFGLRQSLDTVGAAIGPLLAIVLMAVTASNFIAVFWLAVIPAFMSFALIALFVHEPAQHAATPVRSPLSPAQLQRLGRAYWLVVALATVFASPDLRGTAFGMFNLVTGVATLAASIVAGALWDSIGPAGTFPARSWPGRFSRSWRWAWFRWCVAVESRSNRRMISVRCAAQLPHARMTSRAWPMKDPIWIRSDATCWSRAPQRPQ
jgi:hypothetical protein